MPNSISPNITTHKINDGIRNWVMIVLTLAFVGLYGLALAGRIRPLPDTSVVSRLEPLIFVIVGYYFGRLPSQQSEELLKREISRQFQEINLAQHAKNEAVLAHAAIEDRLRSISKTLTTASSSRIFNSSNEDSAHGSQAGEALRLLVITALNIIKP